MHCGCGSCKLIVWHYFIFLLDSRTLIIVWILVRRTKTYIRRKLGEGWKYLIGTVSDKIIMQHRIISNKFTPVEYYLMVCYMCSHRGDTSILLSFQMLRLTVCYMQGHLSLVVKTYMKTVISSLWYTRIVSHNWRFLWVRNIMWDIFRLNTYKITNDVTLWLYGIYV